jgi:hypothetical protein
MTAPHPPKELEAPSPPARRNWAAPIALDARAAANSAFARSGFSDPTILLHWEEIAGAETARLARPIRFSEGPSGGVLTLKAEPGTGLFLQHDTRALTERINTYLGREAVARLRFVQGPLIRRDPPPPKRKPAAPASATDPARAFDGPESVREALIRLAGARQSRL